MNWGWTTAGPCLWRLALFSMALFCAALGACGRRQAGDDHAIRTRLVLKVQPLWGDPAPFRALLASFERQHPELQLALEYIPNASDLAHQFYLTALEGGADDFDVLAIDVVWVHEFARAGWIADLSAAFPAQRLREQFLSGAVASALVESRTFAVPWFVDVGLLYYRTDWVPRAPRTYEELKSFARSALAGHPERVGYVWQGRQYEGLTCNVYEAVWGHGGESLQADKLGLDATATREALHYLRELLTSGLSPASTTSAAEEEARRLFQDGRAVFMRNWPYAYRIAQADDSKIRGLVGVAPLPSTSGEPGAGVLGGFQLAVNAHSKGARLRAAQQLIAHLTSDEANLVMAVNYARNPPRSAAYRTRALREQAPFIADLLPMVERARPRPLTPYYVLLADILQGEFSAVISGLRSPEAALARAQRLASHLSAEEP